MGTMRRQCERGKTMTSTGPSPDKRRSEQVERLRTRLEETRKQYEEMKKEIAPFTQKRRLMRVPTNGEWRETTDLDR